MLSIKHIITSRKDCEITDCGEWKTGSWSSCSTHCGIGYRTREVTCTLDQPEAGGPLNQTKYCNAARKPADKEICGDSTCQRTEFEISTFDKTDLQKVQYTHVHTSKQRLENIQFRQKEKLI